MVAPVDSLIASTARKVPLRMRPDLTASRQRYHGRAYWLVKDPVGLNYYRFKDEEWAILRMFDGRTSLDRLQEKFQQAYPTQEITREELQQFAGMLYQSGLVLADVPGQGKQLRQRRDERRTRERLAALTNILCIRFQGIDPERLLRALHPWFGWFFSPVMFLMVALLACAALGLVLVEFDTFQAKLPGFHEVFTARNVVLLALVLACTKVLHELGHGLACKHYGGECHEMGVMILVLTPCLYCDVSDAWMLPNKWRRVAIDAAGMYVEIALASVCTFLWWFSNPGLVHYLCLNVMLVSSVSTIVFNANPLLRFDGYYILSDIVEIPNLRQKASAVLRRAAGRWILGIEPPDDPFLPERKQVFFALYSIAASVYRWVVLASILFFLYKVFEPYGFQFVGQLIGLMVLYGLLVMPLVKLVKFFHVPGRAQKVKKTRLLLWLGLVGLLGFGAVQLPLPYHVMSTFVVEPVNAKSVFVLVPGKVVDVLVEPGDTVEPDQVLARLQSTDLELEIVRLAREKDLYEVSIENLRLRSGADHQIPQLEKLRDKVAAQLAERQADLERLKLRAPVAGTVLPPPRETRSTDETGRLPPWSGRLLDRKNRGAYAEASSLFCMVGDPKKLEAVLVIDQSDIMFVKAGQEVQLKFDELPGETFRGRIDEIAASRLEASPVNLSAKAGGELATRTDPDGVERPASTSYQARVFIDDPDGRLRLGLKGDAKIRVAPQTVGSRLRRLASETFNFWI